MNVLALTIFSDGIGGKFEDFQSAMNAYFGSIGRIDAFDLLGVPGFVPRLGRGRLLKTMAYFENVIDDLIDVGFGDVTIPDGVGIDHDVWSVLALIEAAGLIGANSSFQVALGQFLLEQFLQIGFGGGIAASAGMAGRSLVSANKDMFLEFRHPLSSSLKSYSETTLSPRRHRAMKTGLAI